MTDLVYVIVFWFIGMFLVPFYCWASGAPAPGALVWVGGGALLGGLIAACIICLCEAWERMQDDDSYGEALTVAGWAACVILAPIFLFYIPGEWILIRFFRSARFWISGTVLVVGVGLYFYDEVRWRCISRRRRAF